jgi:hypothetical protein
MKRAPQRRSQLVALNVGSLQRRRLFGVGGRPDLAADSEKTALLTLTRHSETDDDCFDKRPVDR